MKKSIRSLAAVMLVLGQIPFSVLFNAPINAATNTPTTEQIAEGLEAAEGDTVAVPAATAIHKVNFLDANGNAIADPQLVEDGQKVTTPSVAPKSGYVLKYWSTTNTYTDTFDFDTAITHDTNLYARYGANLYSVVVTVASGSVYDGTPKKPAVTVSYEGVQYVEGVDYTLEYENNTEVGTGRVTVIATQRGSLAGLIQLGFQISWVAPPELPTQAEVAANTGGNQQGTNSLTLKIANRKQGVDVRYMVNSSYFADSTSAYINLTDLNEGTEYKIEACYFVPEYGGVSEIVTQTYKTLKSINEDMITVAPSIYDGTAQTPAVTVADADQTYVEGRDYTVAYANNIDAGDAAEVTIEAIPNNGLLAGEVTKNFTITRGVQPTPTLPTQADLLAGGGVNQIGSDSIKIQVGNVAAGETIQYHETRVGAPVHTTTNGIIELAGLAENTEYTISVRVMGNGNAKTSATVTATYKTLKAITDDMITVVESGGKYDGTEKKPFVMVANGFTLYVQDRDYTLTYSDNINAGTATATVTAIPGNALLAGFGSQTFTIAVGDINPPTLPEQADLVAGVGKNSIGTNSMTIEATGVPAGETIEYTIDDWATTQTTTNNLLELTNLQDDTTFNLQARVKANSNHFASAEALGTYKTLKAITPDMIYVEDGGTYDGTAKTPDVYVTGNDGKMLYVQDVDYTLAYANNIDAGTATIVVTAIPGSGTLGGTTKATFTIDKATWPAPTLPTPADVVAGETTLEITVPDYVPGT
ncbi:MAG: InlB B-repeat-containing protein, partial [Lactobacillaceae bacterium]|nr:InlB B-repeat-containing protein [Lactobacillaceae bacterium]